MVYFICPRFVSFHPQKELSSENLFIAMDVKFAVLLISMIICFLPDWKQVLLSFSIIKNTRTLLNVEKRAATIDCLHGMRFISMTWVVLGHSFIFGIGSIGDYVFI